MPLRCVLSLFTFLNHVGWKCSPPHGVIRFEVGHGEFFPHFLKICIIIRKFFFDIVGSLKVFVFFKDDLFFLLCSFLHWNRMNLLQRSLLDQLSNLFQLLLSRSLPREILFYCVYFRAQLTYLRFYVRRLLIPLFLFLILRDSILIYYDFHRLMLLQLMNQILPLFLFLDLSFVSILCLRF